jgi:NAD(P)-dependent dehydrogenase (short-subunit alcohol dehydrogenase family)
MHIPTFDFLHRTVQQRGSVFYVNGPIARFDSYTIIGIMHPLDDDALTTEEKIWDLTMQINLKGVWWGCKYAIQAMRKNPENSELGLQKGGSVINTASFVAIMGAATPQLACELNEL